MKVSKLGVKPNLIFDERAIHSNEVYDSISGETAEDHINDETIHIHEDEFSSVAFSGDYADLENAPDIKNEITKALEDMEIGNAGNPPTFEIDGNGHLIMEVH